MTDTWDTIKVDPERDRFGRYLVVPAKGGKPKSYTRATTVAETLDDRFNLEQWKQRMVAIGLTQRPDLYARVASIAPTPNPLAPVLEMSVKSQLNTLCNEAREAAAGSAGANLGTALHRFTERLNRGEEVTVPAPWDADIAAYRAALNPELYQIKREWLERIVVLDKLGVAGMFDMILATPYANFITDLKTGATLDFSWCAIAVQLAIYAHADTLYDPATKTHEAMPSVDQNKAIVIHLPAGKATCTLYEVDIAAGWEAVQHAMWAREWRKRKGLATAMQIVSGGASTREDEGQETAASTSTDATIVAGGETEPAVVPAAHAATPGDVDRRNTLIARVKDLSDEQRQEMARRWPEGVPTFKASPSHSDADLDAIELVLGGIDLGGAVGAVPEPAVITPTSLEPAGTAPVPDEGAPLDEQVAEAIKATITALEPDIYTQVTEWAKEAHVAQRGFSLSAPRHRTFRRFEVMRAAIGLAPYPDDVVRAALGFVMGVEMQPAFTVGQALGSLTITEASRLALLADSLGTTIAVIYRGDDPEFDGPGLAAVAA